MKVGAIDKLDRPPRASLLKLLVAPREFDGQRVTTDGLLFLTETDSYVFIYTEDWQRFRLDNAFRVTFSLPPIVPADWRTMLQGKRVEIDATFIAPKSGSFSGAGGGILTEITRIFEINDGYETILELRKDRGKENDPKK